MYLILLFILIAILYLALNPELLIKADPGFASEHDVLKYWNKGFAITGKSRKLSLKATMRHVLAVGQSGSGKSQVIFLPLLLRANGRFSYVVHDPSGELRKASAGYLLKKGYQVRVLNLSSKDSHSYNPLKRIDKSFAAGKRLASVIVTSSLGNSSGEGKFWDIKGEHVLSVFINLAKQLDSKYHHMGTVLFLLNKFSSQPSSIDIFFADKARGQLFEEYKTIIASDPKLLSNIVSTAKAALSLFEDETIMQLCLKDDISFSHLRKEPTVIFLQSSIMQLRYHAPFFSMVIHQMMETMLAELPSKKDLPVAMLLDEMGVLKLPNFSDFLSNSRKYKVACVLGCQTTGQLISKYGKEEGGNILANCYSHLYFSNQPLETATVIERMAGTVEVEIEKGRFEKRLVLPGHEVRTLDPSKGILMLGGLKPILVDLLPAYRNFALKRRMNLPFDAILKDRPEEDISLPFIPKPKRVKE